MTTGTDTGFVGIVGDVSFVDGDHVVAWARAMISTLRETRNLLLCSYTDAKAGLSHQKWRALSGELPPRVRALRVTVPFRLGIFYLDAALAGMNRFLDAYLKNYVEPDDYEDDAEEEAS